MASDSNADMTPEVNNMMLELRTHEDEFFDMFRPENKDKLDLINGIIASLPSDMTNRILLHRYFRVNYMDDVTEEQQKVWHHFMHINYFAKSPMPVMQQLDHPASAKFLHLWERHMRDLTGN